MYLDLHLSKRTELRAHGRLDDTGRPFAELHWDLHGALPDAAGNNTLWGTSTAMRRLAELILEAARLAEEEACWHARTATTAAARPGRVARARCWTPPSATPPRASPSTRPTGPPPPGWGQPGLLLPSRPRV